MDEKYVALVKRIEEEISKSREIERKARENNEYANMHIHIHIAETLRQILDDVEDKHYR
ncbi:hypothetical protein [Paenibacillus sp. ISL-20]|uniref:hypothetical protein n=1 Tax=Paenibacillus sp. ISL-20 TaxID=2819163 RepID=UPI001BE5DFD2|nr:hypothetical protein [Paenibacillus sp. ISL-20]MBT2759899.1 hypothetical protein [Paenibacillus sp. ISL-20]